MQDFHILCFIIKYIKLLVVLVIYLNMKIAIACSAGGHLVHVLQIKKALSRYNYFFITYKQEDTIALKEKKYFVIDPKKNPLGLIKNFFQSAKIIFKEKPDVVFSTGGGCAFFSCFFGKLFGSKIIYLDVYDRINELTLTGKLVYPLADLFLVQWPSTAKKFRKAKYWGAVYP